MGYFNPWRNPPDRDCRTCRFSIGMRDGAHLWCQRHRQVTVFSCACWEREPGTDCKQSRRAAPQVLDGSAST
jgi:hypothetical protein